MVLSELRERGVPVPPTSIPRTCRATPASPSASARTIRPPPAPPSATPSVGPDRRRLVSPPPSLFAVARTDGGGARNSPITRCTSVMQGPNGAASTPSGVPPRPHPASPDEAAAADASDVSASPSRARSSPAIRGARGAVGGADGRIVYKSMTRASSARACSSRSTPAASAPIISPAPTSCATPPASFRRRWRGHRSALSP